MQDGFERLAAILGDLGGPPRRIDWGAAPAGVRIDFPADYRRYAEVYAGRVVFAGGLGVETPLRPRTAQEPTGFEALLEFNREMGEVIEDWYGWEEVEYPDGRPYEPYPAPGGLFCWGSNWSGDHFFWDTADPDPQRWPVVAWDAVCDGFQVYDTGLAGFLAGYAGGEYPEFTDFEPDEDGRPLPLWTPAVPLRTPAVPLRTPAGP
ncbi:hypothetical protein ACFV6F_09165 [Kitasatospora phosalacinea]|uniref:hypothetical protein n=1 Tax=Kitasatospora phosalacinea TaxID=2065 RepID=UPI00365E65B0